MSNTKLSALGKNWTQGVPGSSEAQQGGASAGRIRTFSVVSTGAPSANTTATFNSDRCVFGATGIAMTWPTATDEWGIVDKSTSGWRHEKLPFPCTPCISVLTQGTITSKTLRFRVTGLGQFGEQVQEVTPIITISSGGGTYNFHRIWMSRVFSTITSVEYQTTGTAPTANFVYCGQYFTWDMTLSASNIDIGNSINGRYYFPYNQGIGTQIRLSGERGSLGSRHPEVVSFTLRTPSGGVAGTAQILPLGDIADVAGFTMGYSLAADMGSSATDTLTGITSAEWDGDQNKITLFTASKLANYAGAAGRIKWWDGTSADAYTQTDTAGKIDNPITLIYDLEFRSRRGAQTRKVTLSANGSS